MRVLQVAWEYPPRLYGGLGRHVEGLVAALVADGTDVTVLTPDCVADPPGTPDGPTVLRADPPWVDLPGEHWIGQVVDANVAMVHRALDAGVAADVVHVHDWMAAHAGRTLARVLGAPMVATIHATERGRHMGHLPPGVSGWIDAQERELVAAADAVAVCSQAMADHVTRWLHAPTATVIPNGVRMADWASDVDRVPGRVVFAGRLEHEKGLHVAFEATRDLDVELVVAGQGTQLDRYTAEAHDRVRFVGHLPRPALAALLASAEVVVVPSLYEPFGLAALEAMAAGTPVVASAVGGLREVVTDNAGVLVPADDPQTLAAALEKLLADPGQRAALGRAGRARAEELSWPTAAAAYLALYDHVRPAAAGGR